MQERHYKTILYFISAVILATLAMQVYWNYKNYQAGKQQLRNEVQISLDNAVDTYYTNLAEKSMIGFSISEHGLDIDTDSIHLILEDFIGTPNDSNFKNEVTIEYDNCCDTENVSVFAGKKGANFDTIFTKIQIDKTKRQQLVKWHLNKDSVFENSLAKLTTKVLFAATVDTLNLKQVDLLLIEELKRKKLDIDYFLRFTSEKGIVRNLKNITENKNLLKTRTRSNYLPHNRKLDLYFTNISGTILQKISGGLILSLLFAFAIIASLLYLLHIIKNQKQLAEIKNDLISNITHEFKTPLATIGAAMEGIQVFNTNNDTQKTLNYAKISSTQVDKLTLMVEKLLETATLEGDQLELNLETTDLVTLLENICNKEGFKKEGKNINFQVFGATVTESNKQTKNLIPYPIDRFHFENALNNILDNAIKYGGNTITVTLKKNAKYIEIAIQDNGTSLSQQQSKLVFDKFYRVPKGNTHNVKGFGIGLYYTKTIVEKHQGSINVTVNPTHFKISLPNG